MISPKLFHHVHNVVSRTLEVLSPAPSIALATAQRVEHLEETLHSALEKKIERIERLEGELAEATKRRGPERLERLEAQLDRLADMMEGVLDVLIATHPDSHSLYAALQRDAKTRLRIVRRHEPA